jgi:hypothetical protein
MPYEEEKSDAAAVIRGVVISSLVWVSSNRSGIVIFGM